MEFWGHGWVTQFGISEGKGGLKYWSCPSLCMDIFWNCPIFNILQLPIRSCFHLYVTWQVTQPLPPGAQFSVDTWRSEDRNILFIFWKKYYFKCRWTNHSAKNLCCGDGVSLTFLEVMQCLLIFFLLCCGV